MRGLLVGATGILGSNLFMMSSKAKWTPTYLGPIVRHPKAVELDLINRDAVVDLVEAVRPKVIVHVAGLTKPDDCESNPNLSYRVNVEGSAHLIAAAKMVNARLIFLSSDLVFDGRKDSPYTEEDAVNPQTVYGQHKVIVEGMLQRELTDYLVIRTGVMYGWTPSFLSSIAEWVIESLARGEPVEMFADQYRNMTFVGDMVSFIDVILDSDVTGIVHLASPDCVSRAEFARELARAFGYDLTLIREVSSAILDRAASVPARVALDISKAVKFLGESPQGLRGGVAALRRQYDAGYPQRFSQWYR